MKALLLLLLQVVHKMKVLLLHQEVHKKNLLPFS